MDTGKLRTIGVQTWVRTSDAYTQTTCFDAVHMYAGNLADWVISEAFKYGRDLEKFASCIVDCILMEVFMAKSLRNLALYVEECKEADKPYPPVFFDSESARNVREPSSVYQNGLCRREAKKETQSDYLPGTEFDSAASSPDSLQMLEDDIIRCLQTLTDDEEELLSGHPNSDCFSDISFYQQLSELDSGFFSSEDALSVDQRATNTRRSNLPSLTEELEEIPKFKWPPSTITRKIDKEVPDCAALTSCTTRSFFNEETDHVVERQKTLRNQLVGELKLSVECRRRKIERDGEIVWTPGQQISIGAQDQQYQINDSSVTTAGGALDVVENQSKIGAKCHGLNGSTERNSNEDFKKVQKLDSVSVLPQHISTMTTPNEKQFQDAVIVDRKVSVENNEIHTDTYYAVPVQEVTSKIKVIKAPTYDGIGPTEDGVPTGLRTGVQKEYSSDWYKTMFRSLHRQGKSEEKKSDGYMSDPEFIRKEKAFLSEDEKKSSTITNGSYQNSTANDTKNVLNQSFPAAKSSYTPYSHKPWIISDYEPGHSSIADVEALYENKRHLPPLTSPKPKYICNDGYESDSTLIRKTGKVHTFDPQEQKQWYQEIQRGGDIPIHGLGKPAPEKMKEPVVGPPPPFPSNWSADHYYNIYSTETDPNRNEVPSSYTTDKNVNNHIQEKMPKLQDDFRSKLDEVLLSRQEENLRHSSKKSPIESNQPNSKSLSSSPSASPTCAYKVTVLYDFEAETQRELSLKKGDIVTIRRKIDKNWLEGEYHGVVGILPISYVESVSTKPSKMSGKVIEGSACAMFDFAAQNSVELSLHKDDVVTLVRQVDNNWYEGRLNGKVGIFPVSYVEVISGPQAGLASQTPVPTTIINEVEQVKETQLHSNEVNNKEFSSEKETESGSENEKKCTMVIHNHEGNKVIPYKSIYAYKPQNEDELELREGDVIYVVEKCDDGWFVGTSMRTGLFGTFPGNYVEKM